MPTPQPASMPSGEPGHQPRRQPRRSGGGISANVIAFVVGLPLAAGFLGLVHFGPLQHTSLARYLHHPVECVEVIMFSCAVSALGAKYWRSRRERRACTLEVLPVWNGKTVPVASTTDLLTRIDLLPPWTHDTFLVKRVRNIVEFVHSRGAATELDDQLRSLADADGMALDATYALTKFITWAIPILGFLGTVLGITSAISGISPEQLEKGLNTVTDGLAFAFDATALALSLTMVTMFISFLVERVEHGVLGLVDQYADDELAHRFERSGADAAPFVEAVRQNSEVLLEACGQLVQQQADVWAESFSKSERFRSEADRQRQTADVSQHQRLGAALEGAVTTALERTLQQHAKRLEQLETQTLSSTGDVLKQLNRLAATVTEAATSQQAGVVHLNDGLAAQFDALARLQAGEGQLRRLQESLDQNLATLAGTGAFDEAVQSLTAAIHLLTSRVAPGIGKDAGRTGQRPGAAA